MNTKHLRDIPVGKFFKWANPNDPDAGILYRVLETTEIHKDRVTIEAINTGMNITPTAIVAGSEWVIELL